MADPSAAPLDLEAIRQRLEHRKGTWREECEDIAALLTAYAECQNKLTSALAELEKLKANGQLHEHRSPDGDGRREPSTVVGDSVDSGTGTLTPPQGHVHARDRNRSAGVSSFPLTDERRAGSEPADAHPTCQACVRLQAERDALQAKLIASQDEAWANWNSFKREKAEVARLRRGLEELEQEWRTFAEHWKGTSYANHFGECAEALALLARDPEAE